MNFLIDHLFTNNFLEITEDYTKYITYTINKQTLKRAFIININQLNTGDKKIDNYNMINFLEEIRLELKDNTEYMYIYKPEFSDKLQAYLVMDNFIPFKSVIPVYEVTKITDNVHYDYLLEKIIL